MRTPCYIFSEAAFKERIEKVEEVLKSIPLVYSIKANPFLLHCLPDNISRVEVCSPGELSICERFAIAPDRIIYSGVMKEVSDIKRAISYGAGILTAESIRHVELIQEALKSLAESGSDTGTCLQSNDSEGAASEPGKTLDIILRLSSGNQFGMSKGDIFEVFRRFYGEASGEGQNASDRAFKFENGSSIKGEESQKFGIELHLRGEGSQKSGKELLLKEVRSQEFDKKLRIIGIHYYSGTAKTKKKQIERDLKALEELLEELESAYSWTPEIVEYGPGLASEYFESPYEERDTELLGTIAPLLTAFNGKYPLSIEMGRFLASPAGEYVSRIMDIKENDGVTYVILDGGMHQVNYYGQAMGMRQPPLIQETVRDGPIKPYTLCGSLCTTADVLTRDIPLSPIEIGDILRFRRIGAYSVTESNALFLSRELPRIYLKREMSPGEGEDSQYDSLELLRDFIGTDTFI